MCKLVQIIAHRKSDPLHSAMDHLSIDRYCTDFELFGAVAQLRITQLLAKSTLLQSLYLNCLNYFRLMTRTFSIPPCTKYRPFTISQKVLSCNLLRTKETFNLKKKNDFLSPARGKLLVLFRQIFKDKHCLCRCSLLHT